jgi:cytochrome c oxidase subunit IV
MTQHSDATPTKQYLLIFLAITALVFVQIGTTSMGLGDKTVIVNLLIAGTQACLLAYYFMHLKGADSLTWLIVGAALFWLAILFVLMMTDYITRHLGVY